MDGDAAIRRFAGCDFDYDILTALTWQRRELVADRYQVGRVFFLGDAVHQLSPSGGFGLNTGIGDVTNLSWKLAAMLRGWGTPEEMKILHRALQPERVMYCTTAASEDEAEALLEWFVKHT